MMIAMFGGEACFARPHHRLGSAASAAKFGKALSCFAWEGFSRSFFGKMSGFLQRQSLSLDGNYHTLAVQLTENTDLRAELGIPEVCSPEVLAQVRWGFRVTEFVCARTKLWAAVEGFSSPSNEPWLVNKICHSGRA
jgi:hypothetical protein